ncbi:hypothetical protein LPJ81_003769 [Coemansia sp. IMI 209127]|nr:hypothetical protein LPJ81_003769 [Coemansia sp. IMI 209127]
MFGITGFQTLPAHIMERIVLYVPGIEPTFAMNVYEPGHCDTEPVKAYLPLMGVNRAMRIITAPLFYKYASKLVCETKPPGYNYRIEKDGLSLDDVMEIGAQEHVKQLRLVLDIFALDEETNRDINHIENAVVPSIIKYGQLPAVHTIILATYNNVPLAYAFRRRMGTGLDNPENTGSESPTTTVDIPRRLEAIKHAVLDIAPRVRRLIMSKDIEQLYSPPEHEKKRIRELTDFKEDFVNGLALGHISLVKNTVSKKLLANLSGPEMALRSITLSYNKGSQQHIELVRRNWMRLERLHINHLTAHAVVKMTWCDGGSGTLVYPRLKHLCINVCSGNRSTSYRQPDKDPFPALTTLISHGQFPFATPVVLTEGRKHIRRLDLDLDNDLMEAYGNKLFTDRSFHELESISLGWWAKGPVRASQSQLVLTRALNIGLKTQIAHIHSFEADWLDSSTVKDMHSLSTLRVLDMELTYITPNQALIIFNACPLLQKAYISLRDERSESRVVKMPADSELIEFQEAHKGCTSRIQSLGIYSTQFSRSRRAAEYLMMLANVLPCLKRVCISSFVRVIPNKYIPDKTGARKLFDAINQTRKRKFYKGKPHVHSVDVAIDNCW